MTQNNDETKDVDPKPWFKKKRFIIPLSFFLLAALSSALDSSENTSEKAATKDVKNVDSSKKDAQPKAKEPAGGKFGDYPSTQIEFVRIVDEARQSVRDAETDLQQSVAVRNRDKKLCSILKNNKVTKWTGVIGRVGANGEGKAYVLVDIADKLKVSTWNNALSDIGDNTLIPTSSPFFDELVALKKGDPVDFSGVFLSSNNSCLSKSNLTEFFYGIDPDFVFRFTDISKRT